MVYQCFECLPWFFCCCNFKELKKKIQVPRWAKKKKLYCSFVNSHECSSLPGGPKPVAAQHLGWFQGLAWEAWSKSKKLSWGLNRKLLVNGRNLFCGVSQTREKPRRSCAVVVLGCSGESTWQNPRLGLISVLTPLWAGDWTVAPLEGTSTPQCSGIRSKWLSRLRGTVHVCSARLEWCTLQWAEHWNCFSFSAGSWVVYSK